MIRFYKFNIATTALLLGLSFTARAQQIPLEGWHLQGPDSMGMNGIALQKAKNFLQNKKPKPIIVAVIDSGVDTAHEALKPILWRNPKEIPGNGIDDDGNGYIDDIYGWNFLGGKDGRNIKKASDERSRVYHRFKEAYKDKKIDTATLNNQEKWLYLMWKRAESEMTVTTEEQTEISILEVALKTIKRHNANIINEWKRDTFTTKELESFQPTTSQAKQAKLGYINVMTMLGQEPEEKNVNFITMLEEYVDGKKTSLTAKENAPPDYRADIIKDNYFDPKDKFYGNNDVMGPNSMHGTHVTGIIAAQKGFKEGCEGVCSDNVQVMTLRAVPDGDEWDKDIALAIKYAVDNGAKVINMSFGKSYSPEKLWVDEAIRYAESKDVLIIHAAGNDAKNIDSNYNYPTPYYTGATAQKASNFITVGASSTPLATPNRFIADFSNYGAGTVDVMAPGVKIYSTLPGGNQYGFLKGTSMASPVVAGIAALIRSYYPQLNAAQVKQAIEKTVRTINTSDSASLVVKPGSTEIVPLNTLCNTGGFVDAAAAITYADALHNAQNKAPIKKVPLPKNNTPQLNTPLKKNNVKG
ncbi:MAG: S8 family peptidase [Chitinophagaceae bacterium]